MNYFACLPLDEAAEPQEKVLFVLPSVVEEKFTAVECLDEGGGPFEETKYKRRKGSKTAFNIKNKELNLAKQKRMEAWQLAEKQAQCKLIEFENKAKKGISVSLTENYNDIILKLLHIIHKDKPLSEIEKICKSFIEKLNQFWNEYIQNEMYEERYEYMVKEQDMELALKGIFWCEDSMSYY